MKFRVTVDYFITITEIHEVEVDADEITNFRESPYDYYTDDTLKQKYEGDILDGSFREHIEEINVLDQIVEAVE